MGVVTIGAANMKVRVRSWTAVALWKWVANDPDCGICRLPFDGCCPDCKIPGDDCPLGKKERQDVQNHEL